MGNRLWTFLKAVLAPSRQDILVYNLGDDRNPLKLSRIGLASKIWKSDRLQA